jgi:Cu+-exporting ATPase
MKIHGHPDEEHQRPVPGAGRSSKDPVCGMQVDLAHSAGSFEYKGTTYHFCSNRCHDQFKADPQQFLGRADASVSEELAQTRNCRDTA